MGLNERARLILRILAEADHDLYVSEVARLADIPEPRAGAWLFRFWQVKWAGRAWSGSKRLYPITDLGRAQLAAEDAAVTRAAAADRRRPSDHDRQP